MMQRFLAAVQFLTIVPVGSSASPAQAAFFFPLVGAVLGAAAGGIRSIPPSLLPSAIAATLALLFLIVITGALHEDGLADVFDAFRAGRSPERIHAILKDSRVGVYGAIALVMSLLLRWQAIEALGGRAIPALTAAVGASRGAMVVLGYVSKPAGEGIGKSFCAGLGRPATIAAAVQSAALGFLCGPAAGAAALAGNIMIIAAARSYFHRRIGGITGDCLGAVCQFSEALTLLIFVCPLFI
jgi:adenosylcobinamide-GDP ribazoletransferase